MPNVTVIKPGKTVEVKDGVTTITKMVDGKTVVREFNMGNVTTKTLIGNAGNVKLGSGHIEIGSNPRRKPNPGPVGGGGGGRVPRNVRNQFNITSSNIGQVSIGNTGQTVFNNKQTTYKEGAINNKYHITGGNFAQANLGGVCNYNNDGTKMITGGGDGGGKVGSIDEFVDSDMVAEGYVIEIAKTKITADEFVALLRKGFTIGKIHNSVTKTRNPGRIVASMLQHDGKEDSD